MKNKSSGGEIQWSVACNLNKTCFHLLPNEASLDQGIILGYFLTIFTCQAWQLRLTTAFVFMGR